MKTNRITSGIAACLVMLFLSASSFSQVIVSKAKNAGDGVSATEGCLACPGSEWSDADNIKMQDGFFAITYMAPKDFCFQSACYFSRGLIASDFGFNLPDNAEIKGIQLNVLRKANTAQSVKDYSVRLMKETEPVGNDKKSKAFWPTITGAKKYGGNTDLWGTAWTVAEINDPDFGCLIQSRNTTPSYDVAAEVDLVKMVIYYTLLPGKIVSTMMQPGDVTFDVYPNPASSFLTISFPAAGKTTTYISVSNELGQQVFTLKEQVKEGLFTRTIDLSVVPEGIYLVRVAMNDKVLVKRIIRE